MKNIFHFVDGKEFKGESKRLADVFNPATGEVLSPSKVREAETLTEEFWQPVFEKTNFKEFVKEHYTIGYKSQIDEAVFEDVLEGELDAN